MSDSRATQDLADLLQQLKDRTGRSYEALAQRSGLSRSTVHRYCSGAAVPSQFDALSRLGRVCGASREELLELHRRWAVASAAQSALITGDDAAVAEPAGATIAADREPVPVDDPDVAAEPSTTSLSAPATVRSWYRRPLMIGVAAALIAAAVLVVLSPWKSSGSVEADGDDPLLMSRACAEVIAMGQQDECVREVQRLLARTGTTVGIDGSFGPQTLRKVTAFQVLAGLPAKGVVDNATKRALYEGGVSMATWSPQQVEAQIREVFGPEVAESAVRIARCQSKLDPLYVLPNTNASRNWGLFQLSDGLLSRYDGTPRQALDPQWNIAVAKRAWEEHRDFRHWEHCAAAATPAPSASTGPLGTPSPGSQ